MKVLDLIMNELHEGDVLMFQKLGMLVTLTKIEQPGIIDRNRPGSITLTLQLPCQPDSKSGKEDICFADLLKVHTPNEGERAEKVVEDALREARAKRPHIQ